MKKIWRKGFMLIADNPKTTFWSVVGTGLVLGIKHYFFKKEKKVETECDINKTTRENENEILKKHVDTECDILKKVSDTACEVFKQATSVAPDMKEIKENLKATNEELRAVKEELKATK